jgi:orsellinic acid C2-O-methyltransferase
VTRSATTPGAARQRLMPMLFGFYPTQVLHSLVRLDVPELLGDGAATADRLAAEAGAHPPSLARLLRAGVALELLDMDGDEYRLTEAGRLLRAGVPGSVRNLALLFAGDPVWRSWGRLERGVRTGEPVYREVVGQDPFDHLAEHPDEEAVFNAAMAEGTRAVAPVVVAACDLSGTRRVADIGGGNGVLLAALVNANPGLHGVLFDTPAGLRDAERTLTEAGVRDRCEIVPGDFFASVPERCDAYLLKSVIHDWDDERAVRILRRCREAMSPSSVLYLVEPVVPTDPAELARIGTTLMSDLNMLVCTGGRERTEAEFAGLFASAGLTRPTITACGPPTSFSVLRSVLAGRGPVNRG